MIATVVAAGQMGWGGLAGRALGRRRRRRPARPAARPAAAPQFDLRNGALRKKYDALKYTLKKMESTIYELSLAEGGLARKPEEEPEPAAGAAGGDDA